ncbi:MAG TPA: hypothetical protein DFK19_03835 [Ochrobactrum sp.]|nr:hypothetical protein [Ochrobactrum sp.]
MCVAVVRNQTYSPTPLLPYSLNILPYCPTALLPYPTALLTPLSFHSTESRDGGATWLLIQKFSFETSPFGNPD